jgi:hypothetical protein
LKIAHIDPPRHLRPAVGAEHHLARRIRYSGPEDQRRSQRFGRLSGPDRPELFRHPHPVLGPHQLQRSDQRRADRRRDQARFPLSRA